MSLMIYITLSFVTSHMRNWVIIPYTIVNIITLQYAIIYYVILRYIMSHYASLLRNLYGFALKLRFHRFIKVCGLSNFCQVSNSCVKIFKFHHFCYVFKTGRQIKKHLLVLVHLQMLGKVVLGVSTKCSFFNIFSFKFFWLLFVSIIFNKKMDLETLFWHPCLWAEYIMLFTLIFKVNLLYSTVFAWV